MRSKEVILTAALIILMVAVVALFLGPMGFPKAASSYSTTAISNASLSASTTTTVRIPVASTSSTNSSSGLRLDLSLSINATNEGIVIAEDEFNTLQTTANVTAGDGHWPPGLFAPNIPPCGGPVYYPPMGYAVYEGDYGLNSFASGTLLQLVAPGPTPSCPVLGAVSSYLFGPTGDSALLYFQVEAYNGTNGAPLPPPPENATISDSHTVTGYWTPGVNGAFFQVSFPTGSYTVLAADEWGQLALLHFTVG
jgi:hypothetical protein